MNNENREERIAHAHAYQKKVLIEDILITIGFFMLAVLSVAALIVNARRIYPENSTIVWIVLVVCIGVLWLSFKMIPRHIQRLRDVEGHLEEIEKMEASKNKNKNTNSAPSPSVSNDDTEKQTSPDPKPESTGTASTTAFYIGEFDSDDSDDHYSWRNSITSSDCSCYHSILNDGESDSEYDYSQSNDSDQYRWRKTIPHSEYSQYHIKLEDYETVYEYEDELRDAKRHYDKLHNKD